jgi:hypothetical protein
MQPLPILSTAHLFPLLDQHLLTLLHALEPTDWCKQTVAPKWRVHDVALHLLDGSLRTLSMLRDGHFGSAGPASPAHDDVVQYLNQLNADWVRVGQRLSPQLVTWFLEVIGPAYNTYMASLPMLEPSVFSVGWAGEEQSLNWFHVARDYTEKWHHQQQIRQAVGQEEPLLAPELYYPFLATCVRALPHHYRNVSASPGTTLQFTVTGAGGGTWFLQRQATNWQLGTDYHGPVAAAVTLDGAVAWRLFTKSLPRTQAQPHITTTGESVLTEPIYSLTTVMA